MYTHTNTGLRRRPRRAAPDPAERGGRGAGAARGEERLVLLTMITIWGIRIIMIMIVNRIVSITTGISIGITSIITISCTAIRINITMFIMSIFVHCHYYHY